MLGKYSKEIKEKYKNTEPTLDEKELVMFFKKDGIQIKNQIMQKWETPYMEQLANIATLRGGDILEVGYGMGISAGFIEKSPKIKTHAIIECHPVMIANLKKRFSQQIQEGRVIILEGFWEDVVKRIPKETFDGILFDSCPLDKEVEFFQFFPFFKEAARLLKSNGVFTYFSDEASSISEPHQCELKEAGFTDIRFEICHVEPPKDCIYWKHKTIVAPIIKK